jgi:lysophospholipase L1-like esterase
VTADTFSTQNLFRLALRFFLGGIVLWLLIEIGLWAAFRAPTERQMTLHLENKIPGLKPKVKIVVNPDQQLRVLNWVSGDRPLGSVRILCVGGFATHGQLQNAEDTWWGQLAKLLEEKLPNTKIEIGANGGTGFMSLLGGRWASTFAKDLQPDLIITNFGAGDVLMQPREYKYDPRAIDSAPQFKRELSGPKRLSLQFSQIARWLRARNTTREQAFFQDRLGADDFFADHFVQARAQFAKLNPIENPFRLADADPKNEYLDGLKTINAVAKEVGAKLILTGEPCLCAELMTDEATALRCTFMPKSAAESSLMMKLQSGWVQREIRRFQEAAEEYAQANQLTFVDLNGQVPQDAKHFVTELLLTDEGAKRAAELLLPKVLPVVQSMAKK